MGRSKGIHLELLIVILSLSLISLANAQTIVKPSIPEFQIKVTDHSQTLPPVYEIDQFTGKNITIREGATFKWRTLEFIIKNQPVQDPNNLYYNIRYMGEYANNWTYLYHGDTFVRAELGQTTTITFLVSGQALSGNSYYLPIPVGATVDFQMEAMMGNIFRKSPEFASGYEFRGETSGWSSTQTVTIPDSPNPNPPNPSPSTDPTIASTPTTSPNPTQKDSSNNTLTLPIDSLVAFAVVAVLVSSLVNILLYRRYKK